MAAFEVSGSPWAEVEEPVAGRESELTAMAAAMTTAATATAMPAATTASFDDGALLAVPC